MARGGACTFGCTPAKKSGPEASSLGSSEIVGKCWAGSPESRHPASAQQKVQELSACQPNFEKRFGSSAGKVHRRWVERLAKDFASAARQGAQALPTWHRVRKQLVATVAILKIVVIRGFKGEDFNGIYDQRVSSLEVEPCAENPAPSWVRVQRHESRVNSMPVMLGFWKAVASDVMPKHEYSEADVGAAQIRLVSHRIATIISSATAALARSRSLSSVATSVARAALGTPVGGGGRELRIKLGGNVQGVQAARCFADIEVIVHVPRRQGLVGQSRGARVPIAQDPPGA